VQKNPGLAAILCFFFTGLGQIYNGQIGKGILFIIVQIVNIGLMFILIGFITYPIVWIWGMIDAYKTAEKINKAGAPPAQGGTS
jgi:TM2 domain-containing membrane protein YozV